MRTSSSTLRTDIGNLRLDISNEELLAESSYKAVMQWSKVVRNELLATILKKNVDPPLQQEVRDVLQDTFQVVLAKVLALFEKGIEEKKLGDLPLGIPAYTFEEYERAIRNFAEELQIPKSAYAEDLKMMRKNRTAFSTKFMIGWMKNLERRFEDLIAQYRADAAEYAADPKKFYYDPKGNFACGLEGYLRNTQELWEVAGYYKKILPDARESMGRIADLVAPFIEDLDAKKDPSQPALLANPKGNGTATLSFNTAYIASDKLKKQLEELRSMAKKKS